MMRSLSRRGWVRVISFLAALFLALVGCVLSLRRTMTVYQRSITNGYLRSFSQLVSSVSRIDSAMQKEIYVVTPAMTSLLSAEIQSEAATAQAAMSALPYANIELAQTAAFLSRVGDYASALARSASANGGLSDAEAENLRALSTAASQLRERLETLEGQLNDGSTDLDDVESVERRLSELSEGGDVLAGSSYENIETNFPELPTMTYDGPFSDHLASSEPKMLAGLDEVTGQQALKAAAECTGLRESIFSLTGEAGGEIPFYTCSAVVDGGELNVSVTKQGGKVLALTNSRIVTQRQLSAEQAVQKAQEFLERNGYADMEETYRHESENRLTINFAYRAGEVLCYPDLCSITVALDTGSIVGFESTSYLSNHTERTLDAPAVSVDAARKNVSPLLTIQKEQLALIPTDGKYEVLCWEFICQAENGQHYISCINAATGAEQKMLILLEDENGTLAI